MDCHLLQLPPEGFNDTQTKLGISGLFAGMCFSNSLCFCTICNEAVAGVGLFLHIC